MRRVFNVATAVCFVRLILLVRSTENKSTLDSTYQSGIFMTDRVLPITIMEFSTGKKMNESSVNKKKKNMGQKRKVKKCTERERPMIGRFRAAKKRSETDRC